MLVDGALSTDALGGVIAGVVLSGASILGTIGLALWKLWPTIKEGWKMLSASAESASGSERQLKRLAGAEPARDKDEDLGASNAEPGESGSFRAIVEGVITEQLDERLGPAVKAAVHAELAPLKLGMEGLGHAIDGLRASLDANEDRAQKRTDELSNRIGRSGS